MGSGDDVDFVLLFDSGTSSNSGTNAVAGSRETGATHSCCSRTCKYATIRPLMIHDLLKMPPQPVCSAKVPVFPETLAVPLFAAVAPWLAVTWCFTAGAVLDVEANAGADAV